MADLDEAIELHRDALLLRPPDLLVAKSWAAFADTLNHASALLAYKTALRFLDQQVALLSPSFHHFDVIKEAVSSLATDAFSCSVRQHALTTVVELVEQGRAVFWTQLARFSTPLDELSVSGDTGAALAEEFKRSSFRIRNAFDQSTEDRSSQIRQLTMQWDDVVSRIRMLPDFSRFLLPPLFSDLQKAVLSSLSMLTEVVDLSSEFQSLTKEFGSFDTKLQLVSILRKIWHKVVGPVVQALRVSNVRPNSRIWWCPTAEFALLPLHAAGAYEKKRDSLSHIYISSYTPTLATLVRARRQVSRDASPQHFVAIAPEIAVLTKRLAPVVSSFTRLEDSDATVEGAFDALNRNQWLHMACHGMPNRRQPFESSFAMRDGLLMIKDIIRSNWQDPQFAFLSACHTTVGDEKSPDESIHLAAAMQFSGFRSVIGSMWSVDDEVAQEAASGFYENLIDISGRLDCTRAAMPLHKALKKLRRSGIPLEQQIVFVHIGV
ncbi:CHAT domain-containing protein [Suillus fuscotomentosus]|uniref:CHAT domain-containing protein n=1 Tax=Suillus fuscotomentosus TaxID=1912939 RepID=A0AAD4EME0_9AGAM|nr:CHAT domain-containing protein [Suillus fuscotomentosus]KAG1908857.1 CHAT domain-containing protein [Suillus fuscotomentosus]